MVRRSLASVVDDDESMRKSLPVLLQELGFAAYAFSWAEEFLASDSVGQTKCLILGIAMPGMTGPDLQRELTRCGDRFRSSSSPLTGMRRSVLECSNKVPWSACSSHSATGLCIRHSMPHFE